MHYNGIERTLKYRMQREKKKAHKTTHDEHTNNRHKSFYSFTFGAKRETKMTHIPNFKRSKVTNRSSVCSYCRRKSMTNKLGSHRTKTKKNERKKCNKPKRRVTNATNRSALQKKAASNKLSVKKKSKTNGVRYQWNLFEKQNSRNFLRSRHKVSINMRLQFFGHYASRPLNVNDERRCAILNSFANHTAFMLSVFQQFRPINPERERSNC